MKSHGCSVWGRTTSAIHHLYHLSPSVTSPMRSQTLLRRQLRSCSVFGHFFTKTSTSTFANANRLCASSVRATREQPAQRRSKRFSYADADRVYAAEGGKPSTSNNDNGTSRNLPHGFSPIYQLETIQSQVPPQPDQLQQLLGVFKRLRVCVEQRWMIVLLTLLRTPYVGPAMVRLLEVSAYTAYVKGSVTLFTRRSVRPSILEVANDGVQKDVASRKPAHGQENSMSATVSSAVDPSLSSSSWSSSSLLRAHALDCLYIGQSSIHSRGLFTSKALPKGTRIIAEPQRSLLLAPHFLTLLADTHEKLPDTWHYIQPTGSVVELVTQAQPHHLMNHSCRANVCSGLSHAFWGPALLAAAPAEKCAVEFSGSKTKDGISADTGTSTAYGRCVLLREQLTQWSYFADANSFFLTRDVAAGEELTLDYSTRMAPICAGQSQQGMKAQGWLLCRCGQPCCRHYVYRQSPEITAYLHRLRTTRQKKTASPRALDTQDPMHIAAKLLALGFDDELALLSYAGRPSDVVAYVYGQPLPSFSDRGSNPAVAAQLGIDTQRRRISKRDLLQSYRYVFHLLNEAVPQNPGYLAEGAASVKSKCK